MAVVTRSIGFVCLILSLVGLLLSANGMGSDLDDGGAALCPDSQQELSDALAPAAEHTVGLRLPLPAVALPLSDWFPPRIESISCNGGDYDPPVPHLRGPPLV